MTTTLPDREEQAAALAKANAEKAKKTQAERMAKLKEQRLANETKDAERLADKYRDQSFEDELRKMQLEEMKLELAKKARVERENEVIDAELSHAEATTDVIQSKADSNRNISQGVKSALESEGKAKEEEASGWFHYNVFPNERFVVIEALYRCRAFFYAGLSLPCSCAHCYCALILRH
ncbi:DUF5384 family protein (plasmid) [Vibrio alginolyticus]